MHFACICLMHCNELTSEKYNALSNEIVGKYLMSLLLVYFRVYRIQIYLVVLLFLGKH